MGSDRVSAYSIQEMLCGGDLRSIGRVPEVLGVMEKNPGRMNELVRCLESRDPVVRGRAADALEKLIREATWPSEAVQGGASPRSGRQRAAGSSMAHGADAAATPADPAADSGRLFAPPELLMDRSVIVQVSALQAMFELALKDPSLRGPVRELVEASCRAGAPALRARGRKLLSLLKEEPDGL